MLRNFENKMQFTLWLFVSSTLVNALLLMCKSEASLNYNYHIGRATLVPSGDSTADTKCTKVSYPSLYEFHAHVPPEMLEGAHFGWGQNFANYLVLFTANRHGKLDHLHVSGILNGFAIMDRYIDTEMGICVQAESLEDPSATQDYPGISADWIAILNSVSLNHGNAAGKLPFYAVRAKDVSCVDYAVAARGNLETVLTSVVAKDANDTLQKTSWVDSIHFERDSSEYIVVLCVATGGTIQEESPIETLMLSHFYLFGANALHYGDPPEDTYSSEYGSAKVSIPRASGHSNWNVICVDKPFTQKYSSTPFVFTTVSFRKKSYIVDSVKEPAVTAWVEFVNEVGFRGCMARPYFANAAVGRGAVPYLEYLVISQDGIYDKNLKLDNSDIRLVVELTLKSDASIFAELYSDMPYAVNHLLSFLTDAWFLSFTDGGYIINVEARKIYLFAKLSKDTPDINKILKRLDYATVRSYIPYTMDRGGSQQRVLDILYPYGLTSKDNLVDLRIWKEWACVVGPFDEGECSVSSCKDSFGGTKTIKREIVSVDPSSLCPHQNQTVACNLPPCNLPKQIVHINASKSGALVFLLWIVILIFIGVLAFWTFTHLSFKTFKPFGTDYTFWLDKKC